MGEGVNFSWSTIVRVSEVRKTVEHLPTRREQVFHLVRGLGLAGYSMQEIQEAVDHIKRAY